MLTGVDLSLRATQPMNVAKGHRFGSNVDAKRRRQIGADTPSFLDGSIRGESRGPKPLEAVGTMVGVRATRRAQEVLGISKCSSK